MRQTHTKVVVAKLIIVVFYFSPRISIGSKPIRKLCITCNLRKERCQYYTARFSERSKYYALICYGTYSMGTNIQSITLSDVSKPINNQLVCQCIKIVSNC